MAVFADLDVQRVPALGAFQLRGKAHALDADHSVHGVVQLGFEAVVERAEKIQGPCLRGLHAVQIVFKLGGEIHAEYLGETGHDEVVDDEAQLAGSELALGEIDAPLAPNGGDDGGVGAGRPIPFSSSSLTREASLNRGGGWVKCCLGSYFFRTRAMPSTERIGFYQSPRPKKNRKMSDPPQFNDFTSFSL